MISSSVSVALVASGQRHSDGGNVMVVKQPGGLIGCLITTHLASLISFTFPRALNPSFLLSLLNDVLTAVYTYGNIMTTFEECDTKPSWSILR
jgi:hypothetical protein